MKCANCNYQNRSGVKYCENCGNALRVKVSARAESIPTGNACSSCGTVNRAGIRFCENCGNPLQTKVSSVSHASAHRQACPNCKKQNRAGIRFCENCGFNLSPASAKKNIPSRSPSTSGWFGFAAIALVICVVGGGALGLLGVNSLPSSSINPNNQESQYEQAPQNEQVIVPTIRPQSSAVPLPTAILGIETESIPDEIEPPLPTEEPIETEPILPPEWDLDPYTGPDPKLPSDSGFFLTSNHPDSDGDGLYDSIENWIAQTYAPYYIFDEHEQDKRPCGPLHYMAVNSICIRDVERPMVLRFFYEVVPGEWLDNPAILYVVTAVYDQDYVEYKQGRETVFWHYGDTESVEIYIACQGNDCNQGNYFVSGIQINRHSKGFWYYQQDLSWVNTSGDSNANTSTHPVLYVSQGKHATFVTSAECHDHKVLAPYPFYEDCSGWALGVANMEYSYNVGEEKWPNPEAQIALQKAFPREKIWDRDYKFCGGFNVSESIRAGKGELDILGTNLENCGGSIGSKWWPLDVTAENRQRPPFKDTFPSSYYENVAHTLTFINNADLIYCIDVMGTDRVLHEPLKKDYQVKWEFETNGIYNIMLSFGPNCTGPFEYILDVRIDGETTYSYP